jgi:hypothetical protein
MKWGMHDDGCAAFIGSGLSVEETAARMDVPIDYVHSCLKQ